jgi:hypothetical protein
LDGGAPWQLAAELGTITGGSTSSIQITYPTTGTVIATFTLARTGGSGTQSMQDVTASFAAQTGVGQLCLIGQGSGWIASILYLNVP